MYSHADITVYLLHTTSFVTLEEVKNYISLQSYKYFTAGWVIQHKWKPYKDVCCVIGKVNHSFSLSSPPLKPWVIINKNGTVVCGHCTCMAGLGETCSHVSALLYWIEYKVRRRDEVSSTSKENKWLEPAAITNVPYLQLEDIDFTTAEKKMKSIHNPEESNVSTTIIQLSGIQKLTKKELEEFFKKCNTSTEALPILFSLEEEPFHETFTKSTDHLPLPLQSVYSPENKNCNYVELVNMGQSMYGIMEVTKDQQKHLEELTRTQALYRLWMKFRSGRITASRFYQAVHTDPHKPAISLVRAICYPETVNFVTSATKYGCDHEKEAIESYKLRTLDSHKDLKISPAGFVISTSDAYLGASPDSFLECTCCGAGVLEVKCPYCARSTSLSETAKDKATFCLLETANGLRLRPEHPYFYQCQLQMMVTERKYCDFVVWSPSGELHIERILPMATGEFSIKIEKAKKLFHYAILPELLGKWFTREHVVNTEPRIHHGVIDDHDDGTWCYCQEAKGGDMIGCENRNCNIKWFHWSCMQITEAPKGKWICPTCHANSVTKKKQ